MVAGTVAGLSQYSVVLSSTIILVTVVGSVLASVTVLVIIYTLLLHTRTEMHRLVALGCIVATRTAGQLCYVRGRTIRQKK